ncbi:MAG: hypothetical protein V2A34_04310 [Lentisphaerota bacterium]
MSRVVVAGMIQSNLALGVGVSLFENEGLDSAGGSDTPSFWNGWNGGSHDPDGGTYRSSPNAWAFWWEGGLWQDAVYDFQPGDRIRVSGYMLTPSWDSLRNGSKSGCVQLEFYNGTALVGVVSTPSITSNSASDVWTEYAVETVAPTASVARLVVRCNNAGSGRFLVDDVSARTVNGSDELLINANMESLPGEMPDGWYAGNSAPQGPETQQYRRPYAWTLWSNASICQDISSGFKPGDRIRCGGYLINPSSAPIGNGYVRIFVTSHNASGQLIAAPGGYSYPSLGGSSLRDYRYFSESYFLVPTGAVTLRVRIGYESTNQVAQGRFIVDDPFVRNLSRESTPLLNPALTGWDNAPEAWSAWDSDSHDAEYGVFFSPENAWSFWWSGGIYQEIPLSALNAGFSLGFGGKLLTPSWDALRLGSKNGAIELEYYNASNTLLSASSAPSIHSGSPRDVWIDTYGISTPPTGAASARLVVRCNDAAQGDGRFMADDLCLGYGATLVDSGANPSLAIVHGRPAMAYIKNGQLQYAINSETSGSGSWSNCLVDTSISCSLPVLSVVNGKPAIAYRASASGDLKYARCGATNGLGVWTQSVVDAQYDAGFSPSLAVVGGRPALAAITLRTYTYTKYSTYEYSLKYYTNTLSDGSGAWSGMVVRVGVDNSYGSVWEGIHAASLKAIQGKATIAYDRAGVWCAVNASASQWTNYMVSTNRNITSMTLATIGSRPSVGYHWGYQTQGRALHFCISASTNASGPWTDRVVGTNQYVIGHALAEIGGKPAIAVTRGSYELLRSMHYYHCSAADGTGAWMEYDLFAGGQSGCSLLQMPDKAALAYDDGTGVRFLK